MPTLLTTYQNPICSLNTTYTSTITGSKARVSLAIKYLITINPPLNNNNNIYITYKNINNKIV